MANQASTCGNSGLELYERKSVQGSGNTIPQGSACLLYTGDQIPWWQLPHNQGQGHQVQALSTGPGTAGVGVFVAEEWIEKVFEVQSLRQNHLSEAYSRLACGYLSVCVCSTEWSK